MATFLCMDGLGGTACVTFSYFKKQAELVGHKVVYLATSEIKTHQDRVARVINGMNDFYKPGEKLFLVGQSAGGSAVRIACEDPTLAEKVSGIILLSPAMPRGIWYMTWALFRTMISWRYLWKLLCGVGEIVVRRFDYIQLIFPIKSNLIGHALSRIAPIPSQEARELAFYPPKLKPIDTHVLIIYGKQDRWINSTSFHILARKIGRITKSCKSICFGEAGHLTLMSRGRETVMERVLVWINSIN